MRNIKLILEYEGTKFCGWQYQPRDRTVQGVVEDAILRMTTQKVSLIGAGRTDSGVHALGQTANFRIESDHPPEVFRRGLNAWLPDDVKVVDAAEVDLAFNSRRDAKWRRYRYQVMRRFSPLLRRYAYFEKSPLDIVRMHEAAQALAGRHEFQSFCASGSPVSHHWVDVREVFWKQQGELLVFEVCANRFLYSMVRIIVGTCLEIGQGKLPVETMAEILAAKDRRKASPTAQAQGLFLVEVKYEESDGLLVLDDKDVGI